VLGIVTVYFYYMTTVPARKINKNTKQRRREEQTLMENINKEKDAKKEIKRKEQQFYIVLPAPPGDASHAQWYFTGETRCFLRWELPRWSDLPSTVRGKMLLGSSGRRMASQSPF